jgi:hypothetical protein
MAELYEEPWGAKRLPDLQEVFNIARPASVLEIGCYRGVSTEFWLLHCAKVVAVDPWPDPVVRCEFLGRCGHYPNLQIIEGYSPAALGPIRGGSMDLCYIDGDHSYEAVKSDIGACLDIVKPRGWIGGHDYGGADPGVQKAVDEAFSFRVHRLSSLVHRFSDGSWLVQV